MAAYCLVLACAPAKVTLAPPLGQTGESLLLIAAYIFNWPMAAGRDPDKAISHLWSLSVEEQFYLAWPLVLLALWRWRARAWMVTLLLLGACAVPAGLLAMGATWRRVYFATDARAFELLLGSGLAWVHQHGVLRHIKRFAPDVLVMAIVGVFSVDAVLQRRLWVQPRAVVFLAICCVLAVAAATQLEPGSRAARLFESRALVYLGHRSYALYLWHNPIQFWLRKLPLNERFAAVVILSLAAAELSYRLIERPMLARRSQKPTLPAEVPKDSSLACD